MKSWKRQICFGLGLLGLSVLLYLMHFAIFHDLHHILIYLLGDVAFVPIEVLLVTLIIHELLSRREKLARMNKLNMAIGTFFSEAGAELLGKLAQCEAAPGEISQLLDVEAEWSDADFNSVSQKLACRKPEMKGEIRRLDELCKFLLEKRDFFLRLLENPNLLEHESFTNVLWAVFHLSEELAHRDSFADLPNSDLQHLSGDMLRPYSQLLQHWLAYMRHLKHDYPYLFSLAIRTNPFQPDRSPVVS